MKTYQVILQMDNGEVVKFERDYKNEDGPYWEILETKDIWLGIEKADRTKHVRKDKISSFEIIDLEENRKISDREQKEMRETIKSFRT